MNTSFFAETFPLFNPHHFIRAWDRLSLHETQADLKTCKHLFKTKHPLSMRSKTNIFQSHIKTPERTTHTKTKKTQGFKIGRKEHPISIAEN